MTIEINRGKSLIVYRKNPYNPRAIDRRENKHRARWEHFCSCASEEEANAVLMALEREGQGK